MKNNTTVIRIVKRKKSHGAHHGGAWKVAYADFVTAMMAFFLVMWIIGMDQKLKEEIQSYFNDPYSASRTMAGISQLASGGKSPIASGDVGPGATNWHQLAMVAQKQNFEKIQKKVKQELARRPDLSRLRQHVEVSVSTSGLKIELIEAQDSLFFESGSAQLPAPARDVLAVIARQLGTLANPVVIEGHTDVVPYSENASYSNWELSTDRANAARRAMEATGLRPHQVVEVRGYAATHLRDPQHPQALTNRRVSILVNYGDDTPEDGAKGGQKAEGPLPAGPVLPKPPFEVHIKPR
jgi:chemotaxis protein MotB